MSVGKDAQMSKANEISKMDKARKRRSFFRMAPLYKIFCVRIQLNSHFHTAQGHTQLSRYKAFCFPWQFFVSWAGMDFLNTESTGKTF